MNYIYSAQSIDIDAQHDNHMLMAARSKRKRHIQQPLFRRGGKRRGAGRKPSGARAGERHAPRPDIKPQHGLHVVMRLVPEVGSLRRRDMYKAMRNATLAAARSDWFR